GRDPWGDEPRGWDRLRGELHGARVRARVGASGAGRARRAAGRAELVRWRALWQGAEQGVDARLAPAGPRPRRLAIHRGAERGASFETPPGGGAARPPSSRLEHSDPGGPPMEERGEIGRATGRERVWMWRVAV